MKQVFNQQAFEQALKGIKYANGRVIKLTYETIQDNGVVKATIGYYRLGIQHSHIKRVQDKKAQQIANGQVPQTRTSKDTYVNEYFIQAPNGDLKLKIYPTFNSHMKSQTTYTYNGQNVAKQWLIDNGLIKVRQYNEEPTMFTIWLKNLVAIG